jgi:hypothetical protein
MKSKPPIALLEKTNWMIMSEGIRRQSEIKIGRKE